MSVQLAAEIWSMVKESLPDEERGGMADGLVSILLDNGYELDDIKYEFSGDSDVEEAATYYADETGSEEEIQEEDYYGDEDEDY